MRRQPGVARSIEMLVTQTPSQSYADPRSIAAVYRNRKRLCRQSLFSAGLHFSVPAQERPWVAAQYRSNVSSADKSSPVEDDSRTVGTAWGASIPLGMPADGICSSAGERASTGASGRAIPTGIASTLPSLSASGRSGAASCSASSMRRHLPGLSFSHCGRSLISICKRRIDRVLPVAPLTGGGTLQNALQNVDPPPKNRQ